MVNCMMLRCTVTAEALVMLVSELVERILVEPCRMAQFARIIVAMRMRRILGHAKLT